jgi:uncharacterized membrane protein
LVILGREEGIPRFHVKADGLQLDTDYFYGDLDGDGLAEVPVSRVLGDAKVILRQLAPSPPVSAPHAIFFSADLRQHLEMNRFAVALGGMGCSLEVRDWGDPKMLADADVIVLAAHGDPNGWYGGINGTICTVPTVPELPRRPVIFAGACSTATVGAPILRRFLEKGCRAYIGASSAAYGFTSAYLGNELTMHLVDALRAHPERSVAELVSEARNRFARNNKLEATLQQLERGESPSINLVTVSTALQFQVFGEITATFPHVRPRLPFRPQRLTDRPATLAAGESLSVQFDIGPNDGVSTLLFRADWPKEASAQLKLEVLQNGTLIHRLDWREQREYWAYVDTASGGYWEGGRYHAFALVPLFRRPGHNEAAIRLTGTSTSIRIDPESTVQIWSRRTPLRLPPPQFTRQSGINLLWVCRSEDLEPMRRTLIANERLQFDHHENFGDKLAPYEFPGEPDKLFDLSRYDVIFLDDVGSGYRNFPRGMGTRIRDFVERGGGLIMAGGVDSFSGKQAYAGLTQGGYGPTPIGEALPVRILAGDDCVTKKVRVGRVDVRHPVTEGLEWASIPPLHGYNRVTAKQSAHVLAWIEGTRDPFLVVGQLGQGRTAAVTTRSARDWGSEFKDWVYYRRFWGNLIRWVAKSN